MGKPMTAEEERAVREMEVGMRQMLMDLDGLDADRNRTLDFDEFCQLGGSAGLDHPVSRSRSLGLSCHRLALPCLCLLRKFAHRLDASRCAVKEREMGVHTAQTLRQRFNAIDKDGSGTIDSSEFLSYALRDSLSRSAIDVKALLQRWDTSGDGKVDRKEFRNACRTLYAVSFSDKEIDAVFDEIDYDVSSRKRLEATQ